SSRTYASRPASASGAGHFFQAALGERDGHRPLAHCRSDPLGRAMPHVAGGEDPGNARLERKWVALERPARRPLTASEQIRARQEVAGLVYLEALLGRPGGARLSPDAHEQSLGAVTLDRAGAVFDRDRAQRRLVSIEPLHTRAKTDID